MDKPIKSSVGKLLAQVSIQVYDKEKGWHDGSCDAVREPSSKD